jgi:hypothetical protein
MGYFPPITQDVTTPLGSTVASLVGTVNVESIIRANTLDQMGAPTANVSWNSKRLTNLSNAILSTDAPNVGQLAGTQYPFVVSGCVWTADSPGTTLNCSMTSGTVMIKGILLTVAAVTSRAFTANNDTYVDFTDAGNGTATITYTAVANLTTSPALASTFLNTLRIAVISAGGSAVATAGIGQGNAVTNPHAVLNTTATGALSGGNLPLTATTNAPTGGGWCVATHAGVTSTITFTGVSGSNLTGCTVVSGGSTFANADTVVGVWPVTVGDLLGNPINNAKPYPGMIGWSNWGLGNYTSTATNTSLPICVGNNTTSTIPFIVPAGPSRWIRTVQIPVGLSSTAVAGTNVLVSNYIGGTRMSTSFFQVHIAGDGLPVATLEGYILANPGTYYAYSTCQQNAAGTITVGGQNAVNAFSYVELL